MLNPPLSLAHVRCEGWPSGGSGFWQVWALLTEELDCRREVGLVLGLHDVAGDVDSLLAGDRTLSGLSLSARLMSPKL